MATSSLKLRGKPLRRLCGYLAATAFLCQGYDQAIVNGFLTLDTFTRQFPAMDVIHATKAEKPHRADVQGTVVAIYEVGCALGALSCYSAGDIFGRRKVIFIASLVVIVGAILQASSFSLAQLIVSRVINGLGVGAFTATVPMYVSEIAHAGERGSLVLLEGMFAIGGIFLASWVNFGFFYVESSANWRFPIALQLVFVLVVASTVLFLPESPRWLIEQDRMDDAKAVLSQLNDVPIDSQSISLDIALIQGAMNATNQSMARSSKNPFARTENRLLHRTILAMALLMFAQMTGTNVITFYSNTIFEGTLGYSGTMARVLSGCLQIGHLAGAIIAVFIVDRFSRRVFMITTLALFTIIQSCLAGLTSDLSDPSAGKASIFFMFLALFTFPIGFFLIPFMYAAEISSLHVRAKVTALAAMTSWLFNFLLAMITPIGFTHLHWRYYLVYAATSLTGCITVFIFYPDTRGRSLEEIEAIFVASKSIFDTVRVARVTRIEGDTMEVATDFKAQVQVELKEDVAA